MSAIKIIFFDIDGTLLDPATGQISPKTVEALERLEKKGILRCVVTGRPPASLPDFRGLRFDAMATFNGSFCQAGSDVICSSPIDPADVETVLENAKKLDRPVSIALGDSLAANGWDQDLSDYYRVAGLDLTAAPDFQQRCREDIYQIMLGCRPEDHPAILAGTKNVKMAVSWERAADVIPLSGGKGRAIGHILAYFGLTPEEAMAFGDHHNDLDMLRAVGAGVAMGNATEELKAVAGAVCGPVSQDGIYHYCRELGLI